MSGFPEFLYQLSPRDQQVTWLDPLVRNVNSASAAVLVQAQIVLPSDRATVVWGVDVQATPGAAQTVQRMQFRVLARSDSNVGIRLAGKISAVAAGVRDEFFADFGAGLLLPPGWTIEGNATFDAGVAANTVDFNVAGIHIPPGNIQR